MDLKKYIESGILEQFVLGSLSSQEVIEVEKLMSRHPEIRAEVMAIEDAMENYAKAHAIKPPLGLEQIILNKIEADYSKKNPTESTVKSTETLTKGESPKKGSSKLTIGLLLALAAMCLFALFKLFSVTSNLKTLKFKHDKLNQEYALLKEDCNRSKDIAIASEKYLEFIQDRNTKPIVMEGTENAKEALSTVYWNPRKKKSYLRTIAMPEVPSDKQYQLWAIVDGKPVDMGVFDVAIDANSFIEIPHIEGAQAFAVTLEQKGGVESPTMDQMFVIGENS